MPAVRAGNHAGGAIFRGEIVEQPHRIAHPVAGAVGESPAIGVQGLVCVAVRIGRARVEAAELEARPQDAGHALEHLRRENDLFENAALIDEIGEAARAGLLLELGAGRIAFFSEKLLDAVPRAGEQAGVHQAGQEQVSLFFQLAAVGIGQHGSQRIAAETGGGRHAPNIEIWCVRSGS